MTRHATTFFAFIVCLAFAMAAGAAPVKVHVAEFSVTGAVNKDELRPALQTLLQSRLSSDVVQTVEDRAAADILVTGSYIVFGKVFSMDAVAKALSGKVVGRAFAQGDNQEELIPAVGKLAAALSAEIARGTQPATTAPALSIPAAPPVPAPSVPTTPKQAQQPSAPSDFIQPEKATTGSAWISQRIPGAMSSIAIGRKLPEGEREVFLAGGRTVRYYRIGKGVALVAEAEIGVGGKILGIDTADLDKDGVPEVFVTIRTGNVVASEVYVPGDKALKKIAGNLPYLLRGITLGGKDKKIYAQQLDLEDNFYGDVYELTPKSGAYAVQNPLKLPRGGNIFNFNAFYDNSGLMHFVTINPDGYLIVSLPDGNEIWRSSDKFGGSELFFERIKPTEAFAKNVFIDQRIVVTGKGEVLVPQNSGFWVIGNNRSYSKNTMYAFAWNGVSLEEKWHTKTSQNYLADFAYEPGGNELVLLEVVKKEGLLDKGASAVVFKPIDAK